VTFVGRTAPEILLAARATLQQQRCGLILFHWPDADRAGHEHGWMSAAYREAARRLDATLGLLASLTGIVDDPCTVLIALADHGGGGARPREHDSAHAFDTTIPIVIAGGQVSCGELAPCSSLLDVPATVLWALGVPVPATYAGRPLVEAFAGARDDAARPRPAAPRAIAAST
jgi:arylsulfatase A-like enzyme